MIRTTQTLLFLALATGLGASAGAQPRNDRYEGYHEYDNRNLHQDVARVTRVERMASRDETYLRQECWNEQTRSHEGDYYRDDRGRLYRGDRNNNNTARTVIGALIGGAIGNQVGSGDGRRAATVAGAVVGGAIGNRSGDRDGYASSDGYSHYRDTSGSEIRCRTVEDVASGGYGEMYRVDYTYGGKAYQAMTHSHPGRSLRVTVDVRPRDDLLAGQR